MYRPQNYSCVLLIFYRISKEEDQISATTRSGSASFACGPASLAASPKTSVPVDTPLLPQRPKSAPPAPSHFPSSSPPPTPASNAGILSPAPRPTVQAGLPLLSPPARPATPAPGAWYSRRGCNWTGNGWRLERVVTSTGYYDVYSKTFIFLVGIERTRMRTTMHSRQIHPLERKVGKQYHCIWTIFLT